MQMSKVAPVKRKLRTLFRMQGGKPVFASLYPEDAMARIELVRLGLPASTIETFSIEFKMTQARVFSILGVSKATAMRKLREGANLGLKASERAVFVAGLVKTVRAMIPYSRDEEFSASRWIANWLAEPQNALDGKKPEDFLDTTEGRAIISRLLSKIETGVYS